MKPWLHFIQTREHAKPRFDHETSTNFLCKNAKPRFDHETSTILFILVNLCFDMKPRLTVYAKPRFDHETLTFIWNMIC